MWWYAWKIRHFERIKESGHKVTMAKAETQQLVQDYPQRRRVGSE